MPPLDLFHPVVARWFRSRFAAPTAAQAQGWPAIARNEDTLLAAPALERRARLVAPHRQLVGAHLWSTPGRRRPGQRARHARHRPSARRPRATTVTSAPHASQCPPTACATAAMSDARFSPPTVTSDVNA